MDIKAAEKLANKLMFEHGLLQDGWHFRWDYAKRRFGLCRHSQRQIKLSRKLSAINPEAEVRDTILHEIAHALAGAGHGHDAHWKKECVRIGARPERCYDARKIATIQGAWFAVCPGCKFEYQRFKKPGKPIACGLCCRKYNNRQFTARFQLAWHRRDKVLPPIMPVVTPAPAQPLPPSKWFTFDAAEAVRLYTEGKGVPEIALLFGYAKGHGNNRVRNALIKAGVYKPAPVDYKTISEESS